MTNAARTPCAWVTGTSPGACVVARSRAKTASARPKAQGVATFAATTDQRGEGREAQLSWLARRAWLRFRIRTKRTKYTAVMVPITSQLMGPKYVDTRS